MSVSEKTIEAGLIARELLLRKKVREIFVSCPPSMLLQWKEELEARFGLTFEILDMEYMKRVPWSKRLIEWIREKMCPDLGKAGADWNDIRVLIFTEYDAKRYLVGRLEAALEGSDRAEQRIQIFHGPTPPAKREEIKQAFNTDPRKHPVRILIATVAAREGLNLQAYCHNLFHFDVPWNPSRMEQRNGRVARQLWQSQQYCNKTG